MYGLMCIVRVAAGMYILAADHLECAMLEFMLFPLVRPYETGFFFQRHQITNLRLKTDKISNWKAYL
jgi:hypothetical protein